MAELRHNINIHTKNSMPCSKGTIFNWDKSSMTLKTCSLLSAASSTCMHRHAMHQIRACDAQQQQQWHKQLIWEKGVHHTQKRCHCCAAPSILKVASGVILCSCVAVTLQRHQSFADWALLYRASAGRCCKHMTWLFGPMRYSHMSGSGLPVI